MQTFADFYALIIANSVQLIGSMLIFAILDGLIIVIQPLLVLQTWLFQCQLLQSPIN